MAKGPTMAAGEGAQTLKCNKWVLKVPIHCHGCKREIKKVLHSIEGVYTTSIDPQKQQVTVTGSIDSEILLKKLSKTGKHAEICTEKPGEKCKKNDKPSDPKPCQKKNQTTATSDDAQKKPDKPEIEAPMKNTKEKTPDKKGSDGPGGAEQSPTGECPKTKKGKGQKGNSAGDGKVASGSAGLSKVDQGRCQGGIQANLSPTFEQLDPMVTNGRLPTTVQVLSYNASYPSKADHGVSYQIPLAPAYISHNSNSTEELERYQVEAAAAAFSSFNIFSDENPNGCSVM